MSEMADALVEIGRKDLPTLRDIYKSNGFKSYIGYMTLNNYIGFFEQDVNVKHVNIYCLNGDFTDGTFVVTVNISSIKFDCIWVDWDLLYFQDRNRAYADTLNQSYDNLSRLLYLIDYSKGFIFLAIRPEIRGVLRSALQKMNVDIRSDNRTILYRLPKEEALQLNVE